MDQARVPATWKHVDEKDSRQIRTLEQILIAKVFNFGGICSGAIELSVAAAHMRGEDSGLAR